MKFLLILKYVIDIYLIFIKVRIHNHFKYLLFYFKICILIKNDWLQKYQPRKALQAA